MLNSSEVTLRRCSSLRGVRSALSPKPWKNSKKNLLDAGLPTTVAQGLPNNEGNSVPYKQSSEVTVVATSETKVTDKSYVFDESQIVLKIYGNSLTIGNQVDSRYRRKSSPAVSYPVAERPPENNKTIESDVDEGNKILQEKKKLHPGRYKTNRRRKTTCTPPSCLSSSIGYDSSDSDEDSDPCPKSTPLFYLPPTKNSPVLRKKIGLQKATTKRWKSDNNFQKKIRKFRLEGCTYKVTMEPHAATDDESSRIASSSDSDRPIPSETARSSSLPRESLSSRYSDRSKPGISAQQDMKQAQKWVSEREELARQINLEEPVRLPSTDDEDVNNDWVADDIPIVLPEVESREALDCAALRLRRFTQELGNDDGNVTPLALKETLQYAISVLEMKFLHRTSYSDDDSDADASLQGDSVVPPEIKRWLVHTFSTSGVDGKTKRKGERRTFRSVVHVMQAGMFVDKMFRKSSAAANFHIATEIQNHVKEIEKWEYDIFALEDVSGGNALKYTFHEVLSKYDVIRKYKISVKSLFAFCDRLQIGYRKHNNQYHNPIHAADVTQCVSVFLKESGFVNWLTELEVFAMIFAAAIHDLEHTGTTNNFHTRTRSSLALLYNDKSVLENHHISAAFTILWEDPECDILKSLSKDDYKQFRELVIEMVLATDMSLHFGQIKNMKSMLQHPEKMERSKAMSLMMHCADISHPTRPWEQHHRWTARLIEEFFEQGDKERELRLPLSPLVDRHSTMVAQSQIGFIDYVVKPIFDVLHDLFWRVSVSLTGDLPSYEAEQNGPSTKRPSISHTLRGVPNSSRRYSEATAQSKQAASKTVIKDKMKGFKSTIHHCMVSNRQIWVEKDKEEQLAKQSEEGNRQNSSEGRSSNTHNSSPTT